MIDDDKIAAVLGRPGGSQEHCEALVNLALQHGGADNVTVVVAKYRIPESGGRASER